MTVDLTKFKGTLPYASELFGVYQPLIGWRSEYGKSLVMSEHNRNVSNLLSLMVKDSRLRTEVVASHSPVAPDHTLPPELPSWLDKAVAAQVQSALATFQSRNGRTPNDTEWEALVKATPLAENVRARTALLLPDGHPVDDTDMAVLNKRKLNADQIEALHPIDIPGTHLAVARTSSAQSRKGAAGGGIAAAVQAGTLEYIARTSPHLLTAFSAAKRKWQRALRFVDPLALFNPATQDALLSPIGVMQLFRQYFFEFGSFLGPAVGHVWLSPGSSLELFEIHTRKTIEFREVETRVQTISKSEKAQLSEDELASKVNTDNSSNLSFGISATAGVNFGIAQASASATFGYNSSQKSSQEQAHKHARQQSEKISNELRRDFKTTFRTTVEVQDTSSKRYVLQNTTGQLVNYELRRKMRQVGVQLQHIGSQLCWQVYIDDPGASLDIAELVHIAKRGDLTGQFQPPEAPPPMEPVEKDFEAVFPYVGDPDEMDETYDKGQQEISTTVMLTPFGTLSSSDDGPTIKSQMNFPVTPPAGYVLDHVNLQDVQGTGTDGDLPSPAFADCTVHHSADFKQQWISVALTQINFQNNPALRLLLSITFQPTADTLSKVQTAFDAKMTEYKQATSRAQHTEFVRAVRERVKLAGDVTRRQPDDLRAEERTLIFRSLIRRLLPGAADEKGHVTVELIRAIFDVDKMLYFVAENWWTPVLRKPGHIRRLHTAAESLMADDSFGWGGFYSASHGKYHITEDSNPAPLGASLGWLLQLDGDSHRNAFLNSPFVKAVIPIRPGHELAAIEWMERGVEGKDGLDVPYRGTEPEFQGLSVRKVLLALAGQINQHNTDIANVLQAETVYENGFDPLEAGFNATPAPFRVFSQWIEVLPTEQIAAIEYQPPPLP